MNKMNLSLISKNRNTIYGISMLWIMLFHSSLAFDKPWMLPLAKLKALGNCGVDIFLFVSGISLYFSLIKGISLIEFYKRRLKRIILPAAITSILWFGIFSPNKSTSISAFFLDVTGISLFTNKNKNIWFITAILLCYAIYPVLFTFFKRANNSIWALFLALSACIMLNIILHNTFPLLWKNSEILFRRIPVFIIGSYMGKFVYEKQITRFTVNQVLCIVISTVIIYLLTEKYWRNLVSVRYAYIVLGINLTILFSILGNMPLINRIASWFAPITLETYLCHEKWIKTITRCFPSMRLLSVNIVAFALTILTAHILLKIENSILSSKSHTI